MPCQALRLCTINMAVRSISQTQSKLYLPGRTRGGYNPVTRTVIGMAGHQKIGMVEQIEEFAAELQYFPLRQMERANDGRIHIEDAVRAHQSDALIPKLIRGW